MSMLSKPYFHDERAAFEHLERTLWAAGPVCPHCGTVGRATKFQGEKHRLGVWKCNERECRKQFTVKVGTVFEHGRMPLHKMLQAIYLMTASKKGISAHQLHRTLEITYKSAWFLAHRIREAMREGKLGPLGGNGGTVEMDTTFIGGREKNKHASKRRGFGTGGFGKEPVLALVERDGDVRSHHLATVTAKNVGKILDAQLHDDAILYTDDDKTFRSAGVKPKHRPDAVVKHSTGEYVRGDVHTNTIEGYFSILKRGITGTYHHVSQQHLKRYLAEFDFRYNERSSRGVEDAQRTEKAMKGIIGKRLTYRAADSDDAN